MEVGGRISEKAKSGIKVFSIDCQKLRNMKMKFISFKSLFLMNFSICFALCATSSDDIELEKTYDAAYEKSDANTYLTILRKLAGECSSVIELGENNMISTWGLLLGLAEAQFKEKSYIRIDRYAHPIEPYRASVVLSETNGISFFNSKLHALGEMKADLLFIDAKEYADLLPELERHASRICKYVLIYKEMGNSEASWQRADWIKQLIFIKGGDFEWDLVPSSSDSLIIFKRKELCEVPQPKRFEDSEKAKIDHVLNNKIILCTGPSLRRGKLLKITTENDMKLIPFKKIFFSTNDPELQDITFHDKRPICQLIQERGHQLDCLNCMLTTIKNAVTNKEVDDDDIIIFKHETVFINDMNLVRNCIQKILDGASVVIRYSEKIDSCMTDVFFAKVSAVREQFREQVEVPRFPDDAHFCEDYLTKKVLKFIPNIHWIHYSHHTRKDTELGFFHIPYSDEEDWGEYWDKKNYLELFNTAS